MSASSSSSAKDAVEQMRRLGREIMDGVKDPKFRAWLARHQDHRMAYSESYMYGEYKRFLEDMKDVHGVSVSVAGRTNPPVVETKQPAKTRPRVQFAADQETLRCEPVDSETVADAIGVLTASMEQAANELLDLHETEKFISPWDRKDYNAQCEELRSRILRLKQTIETKQSRSACDTTDGHYVNMGASTRPNVLEQFQDRVIRAAKHARQVEGQEDGSGSDEEGSDRNEKSRMHAMALENRLAASAQRGMSRTGPQHGSSSGGSPVQQPTGRIVGGVLRRTGNRHPQPADHSGTIYGLYNW